MSLAPMPSHPPGRTATGAESGPPAATSSRAGWVHFALAAGVLLVAGIGWNAAMAWLKWSLVKEPVPSPPGTQVENYRLVNFPPELPPREQRMPGQPPRYVLLGYKGPGAPGFTSPGAPTGVRTDEHGQEPDGITRLEKDDELETLGIKAHAWNWYYFATYRDAKGARYRLGVTYYTGLLDAVPHVPGICLTAAGLDLVPALCRSVEWSMPSPQPPWQRTSMWRTAFETQGGRYYEYHVFSMNGVPTDDRMRVRRELTWPWSKYCYFAKIQIAPLFAEPDVQKADEAARDFADAALPAVIRFLPSAQEVGALEAKARETHK